jgi:hypothetical protein
VCTSSSAHEYKQNFAFSGKKSITNFTVEKFRAIQPGGVLE